MIFIHLAEGLEFFSLEHQFTKRRQDTFPLAGQFRVRFQQWTIFADCIGGSQNRADGGYYLKDDQLYVVEEIPLATVFHQIGYAVVGVLQ